jgi:Fe-S-cluster-containing dehydrogenase component
MSSRCPGQSNRSLKAEIRECPNCGYGVELFSDEIKVKCSRCNHYVYQERNPSCVQWCAAARQCLGEEKWRESMGDDGPKGKKDVRQADSEASSSHSS